MDGNIVFLGIKHCGKSTQGKLLARKLHREFLDTDDMLAAAYMRDFSKNADESTPRAVMRRHGEEFFRKFEAAVISDFLNDPAQKACVIALGGGVASNPFITTDELKKLGTLIFLDIDQDTAFERIAARGIPPFLAGDDPRQKFMQLCEKRIPRCREISDITITVPENPVASDLSDTIYNLLAEKKLI